MYNLEQLSIRAKTIIGVKCLQRYCSFNLIEHPAIDEFCKHMFKLAEATDIPQWDSDASKISITGLGDELPSDLKNCDVINEITCNIREISATPIYSVHNPKVTNTLLNKAAKISGVKLAEVNLNLFGKHKLDNDGWGKPVSVELLNEWHNVI